MARRLRGPQKLLEGRVTAPGSGWGRLVHLPVAERAAQTGVARADPGAPAPRLGLAQAAHGPQASAGPWRGAGVTCGADRAQGGPAGCDRACHVLPTRGSPGRRRSPSSRTPFPTPALAPPPETAPACLPPAGSPPSGTQPIDTGRHGLSGGELRAALRALLPTGGGTVGGWKTEGPRGLTGKTARLAVSRQHPSLWGTRQELPNGC